MTHVVINDYVMHQRVDLFFTREDFKAVEEVWNDEDRLLVDLQKTSYFEGRTRWSELDPFHFRMMLTKNFQRVASLPEAERGDSEHAYVKSLHFLICGLILALEKRSDSSIETMKFQRVGEYDLSVEFSSVMEMHVPTVKASAPKFSIVVDKDKDD